MAVDGGEEEYGKSGVRCHETLGALKGMERLMEVSKKLASPRNYSITIPEREISQRTHKAERTRRS